MAIKVIVSSVRRQHKQQTLSKKLQLYRETRFNSALFMMDVFREVFDELTSVLINNKLIGNFKRIDKQMLDDIDVFLYPFQKVIEALSKAKTPSLYRVIRLR